MTDPRPPYASVEFSTLTGVIRNIRAGADTAVVMLDDVPDTARTVLVRVLDTNRHAAHTFTVRQEPGVTLVVSLHPQGSCGLTAHAPDHDHSPSPT